MHGMVHGKPLQSCLTVCDPIDCKPTRFLCPWDSPGKKTGVGCHFPLQEIFLAQGLNPCLLHWQADSFPRSHLGSPFWIPIQAIIGLDPLLTGCPVRRRSSTETHLCLWCPGSRLHARGVGLSLCCSFSSVPAPQAVQAERETGPHKPNHRAVGGRLSHSNGRFPSSFPGKHGKAVVWSSL